ncbi:MAG: site-specific integrase, partial [Planctomycetes bacterium]|nr:site-specific integrase [Planctomycetota bacterium]
TKRLIDITTADVAKWHSRLGREHGKVAANRCRTLLATLFGKPARKFGFKGASPVRDVARFEEHSRERFLQADEFRPFFAAVAEEPEPFRDFWLVLLFSGARLETVMSMRWSDVNLGAGEWALPGARTKNKTPIVLALPGPAVEILRHRKENTNGSKWVFPAAGSDSGHLSAPYRSWGRIKERSGLENIRPHDMRRTMGSWMAKSGVSLAIVGKSLGHRDLKSTQIYARLQVESVKSSVDSTVSAMIEAGGPLKGPEKEGGDDE